MVHCPEFSSVPDSTPATQYSITRSPELSSVPDSTLATQISSTYSGLKPTSLADCTYHSKLYTILTSDIYSLYFILFYFILF